MSQYFHGSQYTHSYFEGWYFKHQAKEHTLILIPAFHLGPKGQPYASLQVILDQSSFYLPFPSSAFEADPDRLYVRLGQSVFTEKGCRIHLDFPGCRIRGHLRYGNLHPPKRSFMGPFQKLPLPCFHEVLSLSHSLRGQLRVNGQIWDFDGGCGYLEKDWGTGFPDSYLWVQCSWDSLPDDSCPSPSRSGSSLSHSSFMLTVADLKLHRYPITACSSLILHNGKQYRFSTYQGARLTRYGARRIALRQGPYLLQVILPEENAVPLHAPQKGRMNRTIEEHPRCPLRCQLYKGSSKILDEEPEWGSFEMV